MKIYIGKAPVSGFVVEKTAAPGMELRSDDPENLFTISNLDHVWVMANVYESDLANVHEGDAARITTLSYPDRVYQGRIDKVFNVFDPESKTEKVRITLPNADNTLKPEMFANVSVQYAGKDRRVAIPAKAIVFADSRNFVVIANAQNQPVVREVNPFKTIGATTYLNSGVQAGERVVTQNQLLIYSHIVDVVDLSPDFLRVLPAPRYQGIGQHQQTSVCRSVMIVSILFPSSLQNITTRCCCFATMTYFFRKFG